MKGSLALCIFVLSPAVLHLHQTVMNQTYLVCTVTPLGSSDMEKKNLNCTVYFEYVTF